MTLKWYKVLAVAFVLVTSVRVEEIDEGWPLAKAQGHNGDNPRAASADHEDLTFDYNEEQAMEPAMTNNLSSKESFSEKISEGEGLEKLKDNDEVEDLAYDSDIEKINTKTGLDDVDTGKQSQDDDEMAVPHQKSSDIRHTQHWDDKPKCFIVRRGRPREKFAQKDLPRDTREPEPSIYYDMKRAKRRMLTFPRHGSEDRSTWGAKIIKKLETALNTKANKMNNMDSRQSKERKISTVPDLGLRHKSASQHEDIIRTTLLTDHRLPVTNNQHEGSNHSTFDRIQSGKTRVISPAQKRRNTLPYNGLSTPMVNLDKIQDVDPHKREKLYISWSKYSDSDDSSDEQEARADVMPYIEEGRKYVIPSYNRNRESSSFEQDKEERTDAPKKQNNLSPAVSLIRTTNLASKHNSHEESSVEKMTNVMSQQSVENPIIRVQNFYPFQQNHPSRIESQSNENLSLESSEERPIIENSASSNQISSQEFSLEGSNSLDSMRPYQNHRQMTEPENHMVHEPYRTSTFKLPLIDSHPETRKKYGKSHEEELSPDVGKGATQVHTGDRLRLEPDWPVPVVMSGLDELFELPRASKPMRKHWENFYKSVSRGDAIALKPVLIIWLQYLLSVI